VRWFYSLELFYQFNSIIMFYFSHRGQNWLGN